MAILSFQSRVVWGHVGNSVAEFALRRTGVDVWPLDTVCLSHHPGHGRPRGRVRPADELADLVAGLDEAGALAGCHAVLSGYLGTRDNGRAVLATVARLKALRPDALYCCDPVMGDHDAGLYVDAGPVSFFRDEALPAADILTPNHFELETLVASPLPTVDSVLAAADRLRADGPSMLLISSLTESVANRQIGTMLVAADGAWLATTPRLALRARGAGDLLAAQFLAQRLRGEGSAGCLTAAVAATFAVLEATGNAPELRLVAAQQAMACPVSHTVSLHRLR
ncbi:MAG TPA: pyridoxal kinase PdxY [Rhodospirillales bacterium]|nr:pyridoxal kinase PdxY [Rhodospirillales bacterium]